MVMIDFFTISMALCWAFQMYYQFYWFDFDTAKRWDAFIETFTRRNFETWNLTCWIPGVEGTAVAAHEPMGTVAAPFCIIAAAAAAAAAALEPGVPVAP